MLEAAGMPDPGMDATGMTLSIIVVVVLMISFAVRDRHHRG